MAQAARKQADKLKVSESLRSSLYTPKFNPLQMKAAKEAAAAAAARDQQLAKKVTQAKQAAEAAAKAKAAADVKQKRANAALAEAAKRNAVKAKLNHPMVLSVKVWALAHLLANPRLADVVLFGAFLLWSVLNFRAARQRDRLAAASLSPGQGSGALEPEVSSAATWRAIGIGVVVWAILLSRGHAWLFGVSPLGA